MKNKRNIVRILVISSTTSLASYDSPFYLAFDSHFLIDGTDIKLSAVDISVFNYSNFFYRSRSAPLKLKKKVYI